MFNRFQFNESIDQQNDGQFNASVLPVSNYSLTDDIIFNNFGLQNSVYLISEVDISMPDRELNIASLPSMDGEVFNSEYLRRKIITLNGRIFQTTQALLEAEIDNFKQAMIKENGNLDIAVVTDGTKRRYKATLQNPDRIFFARKRSDISSAPFTLQFLCHNGLAEDIDFTNDGIPITSKTVSTALYNQGTFETPVWWYFICTTVSGITAIQIDNKTTGESIKMTETVSSGDVVQFDGIEKEVLLNDVVQDFDGFFPSLAPGENLIDVTFTGTSVTTVTATAKYKNRYL
jgi:hypothetical protein